MGMSAPVLDEECSEKRLKSKGCRCAKRERNIRSMREGSQRGGCGHQSEQRGGGVSSAKKRWGRKKKQVAQKEEVERRQVREGQAGKRNTGSRKSERRRVGEKWGQGSQVPREMGGGRWVSEFRWLGEMSLM